MDDAVRRAFTELTIAVVEQAFRYARGNIACQDTVELETNGCERCELRDTCDIKNDLSLIIEARKWVVGDGVSFMDQMGIDYNADDIRRLL